MNIGSGSNPMEGYINIDNRDLGDNMVWDVTNGIPFPDESVDKIVSSHFLEHLTDKESLQFLDEALRVLKHGSELGIVVPHVLSPGAFYPGHLSFWNEQRVDALQRLEHPPRPFSVLKNEKRGDDLIFFFKKL